MALTFTVVESTSTKLWDYGWFDHTHFLVSGPALDREDSRSVLAGFLHDPISQRSFCESPNPWGAPVGRRGPYFIESLNVDWYQPLSAKGLEDQVRTILEDPEFSWSPPKEQRRPVEEWLDATRTRGDDAFVLVAPPSPNVKVDWAFVWHLHHEFVCVDRMRERLTVAVIGLD